MIATRRFLIALVSVLAWSTPTGAQRASPSVSLEELDAYVARAARDWHVPGLAIAIVKDDSVVFVKGYGIREIGKADPANVGTRFAIGSTTKAMTAAALGMLVDDGKIGWDDPVIKHLPDFRLSDPFVTRELTVRDLVTHRGGLGNADMVWYGSDYTPTEIVSRVRTLPLAYSLRSSWIYQNVMYAVAGDVVEVASGMPWDAFLRTRIFTPLGMSATEPTLTALASQTNVATPHAEINDTLRVITNRTVDQVKAAGSVWSSVTDMAKWMRFILDSGRVGGKRLLSDTTFAELLSPQAIADASIYPPTSLLRPHFFTYGLGWFLHDFDGQAVAMHTGSIDGMSAIIGLIPDRRLGVYILANRDHAELRHALMYEVFDLFSGNTPRDWNARILEFYGQRRKAARAEEKKQEASRVAKTNPSLPLDRYAGTYSNPTFGDVVITAPKKALHLEFGSQRKAELTHWHFETFRARWSDVRLDASNVVFLPDGAGGIGAVRTFGQTFTRAKPR